LTAGNAENLTTKVSAARGITTVRMSSLDLGRKHFFEKVTITTVPVQPEPRRSAELSPTSAMDFASIVSKNMLTAMLEAGTPGNDETKRPSAPSSPFQATYQKDAVIRMWQ